MKPTVLVIEDDLGTRASLVDLFAEEGYRVLSAEHGTQALEILADETTNLIVTDLGMPVMNGWQLLSRLKRRPELRGIPIVVFSADFRPNGISTEIPILKKPEDLGRLLAVVRASLERVTKCAA